MSSRTNDTATITKMGIDSIQVGLFYGFYLYFTGSCYSRLLQVPRGYFTGRTMMLELSNPTTSTSVR